MHEPGGVTQECGPLGRHEGGSDLHPTLQLGCILLFFGGGVVSYS